MSKQQRRTPATVPTIIVRDDTIEIYRGANVTRATIVVEQHTESAAAVIRGACADSYRAGREHAAMELLAAMNGAIDTITANHTGWIG